jgi:murein DD-endopeptidase MepM/ murein hydrolase activator NlpD
VKKGQIISATDIIGEQGNTGMRCKGSHVHYELIYAGKPINPLGFVYAKHLKKSGAIA